MSDKTEGKPLLLVFFGKIGGGKSFFSRTWAEKEQCGYFNSDEVRKDIAGMAADTRQWVDFNTGIYSPEMSRKTYDALISFAQKELIAGKDCVLDASYSSERERQLVVEKLSGYSKILFIHCDCPEEVLFERMALRAQDKSAASDGRLEIYQKQKQLFNDTAEIPHSSMIMVNTDKHIDCLIVELEKYLENKRSFDA